MNCLMKMTTRRDWTAPLDNFITSDTVDSRTRRNSRVRVRHCPGTNKIRPSRNKRRSVRIGNWNVGTMTSKSLELEAIMKLRRIDILTVQETKWSNLGNKSRYLDLKTKSFKLYFHGVESGKNGVGIIVSAKYLDNIIEVTKVSDRLMSLKLVIDEEIWNIISGYAPQDGCSEEEKTIFWNDVGTLLNRIPKDELVVVSAYLNGHVGHSNFGYEECHGGYGYGTRNSAGEEILNMCKAKGLIVLNTMFIKQERHLITYRSGPHATQIDYQLCSKFMKRRVKDCKFILGEPLVSQHRLLLTEFFVKGDGKATRPKAPDRIRWWNLTTENGQKFVEESQSWLQDVINCEEELSS